MVIIFLFCSLHKIHERLYFYYYLNKWLNLAWAVSKGSHAFFYTAGFCCASFKTFCMFLLICVYSMFLNNVQLSGELWEIKYVDTVCLYIECLLWFPFCVDFDFLTDINNRKKYIYNRSYEYLKGSTTQRYSVPSTTSNSIGVEGTLLLIGCAQPLVGLGPQFLVCYTILSSPCVHSWLKEDILATSVNCISLRMYWCLRSFVIIVIYF